ncbi:P-loop containing nucleoside triphosphate hydrolase protein [Scleroderma citrinum]
MVQDTLLRDLAFLSENLFLHTTCRLDSRGQVLFIRVYMIPVDLPNVQGRLHCRSEAIMKEGRRYLHSILPLVSQNPLLWNAECHGLTSPDEYFLPRNIDNRTMAEIYNDLNSPMVSDTCVPLSRQIANGSRIWGLRSQLYEYQRRSVAVMIDKELCCMPVQDPLFVTVCGMRGEKCFLQPSSMTFLCQQPMVFNSRGGLLCEELGTGKTIIILGLVLATIGQLPEPEESIHATRPVLTPLSYRHFDLPDCTAARTTAGMGPIADTRCIPSLVEILLHRICSSDGATNLREYEEKLEGSPLWLWLRSNIPFYHHYDMKPATEEFGLSRLHDNLVLGPRVMYLSRATLVIVPLNLLGQWDREIYKHCQPNVKCLIVRRSDTLPPARVLATDYDPGFRKESTKKQTIRLHILKHCACPCFEGSRVPDCRCTGDSQVTPLLQIRWKRLIVDEGHISGNVSAIVNHFVRQLSFERKWIVTGTPTSNILGLNLGRESEVHEMDVTISKSPNPSDTVLSSAPQEHTEAPVVKETGLRIWGRYDRDNLRKLGTMVRDFLAVPPFGANHQAFGLHVSSPLCDRRGPRPMAINILSQVMQMVMVRHRVEDVEKYVSLPPMRHEIVYMDLSEFALKSYNAMQAGIVINAVDSERQGQDYLFHPSNVKQLQGAMDNMSQGMFWSASDILYNVDQICEEAESFRARALERQIPREDFDLLESALNHANARATAAKDYLWRAMQHYVDVPFKVTGLESGIFEAWTRGELKMTTREVDLMHPNRLIQLRNAVREQPLISKETVVNRGIRVNQEELQESLQAREARHVDQARKIARKVKEEIKVLKKKTMLSCPVGLLGSTTESRSEPSAKESPDQPLNPQLIDESLLSGVRIGSSLSTKLNYILSEALLYSPQEKFLIFSKSPLTLAHVAEGLSLFGIKYLRYTCDMPPLLREQVVMTFETSDTYRIFLIELKLGARGLNLVSTSRVIFCEPVWHPDVESQAIKRVHRIGQVNRIIVKTLVIRSTAEEAMLSRRRHLESNQQVPKMMTESGMRHFLEHPHFLDSSSEPERLSILLIDADTKHGSTGRNSDDLAATVGVDSSSTHNMCKGSVRKKGRISVVRLAEDA